MKITSIFTRASDDTLLMFDKRKKVLSSISLCMMAGELRISIMWKIKLRISVKIFFFILSKGNLFSSVIRSDCGLATQSGYQAHLPVLRANILMVQEQYFYQSYPTIIYRIYFSRSLDLEISCRQICCSEAFNHNIFFVMYKTFNKYPHRLGTKNLK